MIKNVFYIFFKTVFKKIFKFQGRSNKKEYLVFIAFETVIFTTIYIYLDKVKGIPSTFDFVILIIGLIFILIHLVASTSLTIRRLHDCNLKGWWYLLSLIFSPVIFLILCLVKGDKGKNKYGDPPEY